MKKINMNTFCFLSVAKLHYGLTANENKVIRGFSGFYLFGYYS